MQVSFKMKKLAQLMLSGALISAAQLSFAQDTVDLGTVQSGGETRRAAPSHRSCCRREAPSGATAVCGLSA